MPKDFPECYNAENGITEWQCDGMCDPIYIGDGEFIGFKSLCGTCQDNREAIFEYPCRDSYCLGDQIIRLKGSQVAGNRRNVKENPEWVFPPIRCKECRDWLKNAAQLKKKCEACSTVFVIGAGQIKQIKKHKGDPKVFGPKFCPKCERLTEEERQKLTQKRAAYNKVTKVRKDQIKDFVLLPDKPVQFEERKSEIALDRLASLVNEEQLVAIMEAKPIMVVTSDMDILRYEKEKHDIDGTRSAHLSKHLHEFSPPFGSLKDLLGHVDKVMNNAEPGRVLNMYDKRYDTNLKLDTQTGILVVFNKHTNRYISTFQISRNDRTPEAFVNKVSDKFQKGHWGPPN